MLWLRYLIGVPAGIAILVYLGWPPYWRERKDDFFTFYSRRDVAWYVDHPRIRTAMEEKCFMFSDTPPPPASECRKVETAERQTEEQLQIQWDSPR